LKEYFESSSVTSAYVPVTSNLEEHSPVFSGEEKRILPISPFIREYSPKFS